LQVGWSQPNLGRLPERRFTLDSSGRGKAGRAFDDVSRASSQRSEEACARSGSARKGDDIRCKRRFRAGATAGKTHELWMNYSDWDMNATTTWLGSMEPWRPQGGVSAWTAIFSCHAGIGLKTSIKLVFH